MALTSPAPSDVATQQHQLDALKLDLRRAFKQCGPNFLTPHPTHGDRIFVIAPEGAHLPREFCSQKGKVQRSALHDEIDESALDELIIKLSQNGKFHIKRCTDDLGIDWPCYIIEYYHGDEWS
jgi:hypothetical protein